MSRRMHRRSSFMRFSLLRSDYLTERTLVKKSAEACLEAAISPSTQARASQNDAIQTCLVRTRAAAMSFLALQRAPVPGKFSVDDVFVVANGGLQPVGDERQLR